MAVRWGAPNHTGDLGPEHEGKLRSVLIEAASEQRIGECHPGGMHIDDHPVAGWFVDLGHLDRVRTIEPSHPYRAHATSVVSFDPQ